MSDKMQLDLYYLGQDRKNGAFERGIAHEVRRSLGVRISRPIAVEQVCQGHVHARRHRVFLCGTIQLNSQDTFGLLGDDVAHCVLRLK